MADQRRVQPSTDRTKLGTRIGVICCNYDDQNKPDVRARIEEQTAKYVQALDRLSDTDTKRQVPCLKELTGDDKIQARPLYRDPIEFKPRFKQNLVAPAVAAKPAEPTAPPPPAELTAPAATPRKQVVFKKKSAV